MTGRPTLLLLLLSLFRHASSFSTQPTTMFQNAQAVIFDVDGTLADSGKLGFDATLKILKRYDIAPIDYKEYCRCCRYTTPDRLAHHAGLAPGTEEFFKMGKQLGQEFDDLYIDLVSFETAAFYPGMHELVYNLPETIQVGALTNAAVKYAHRVLRVNCKDGSLYNRFGSILGADNVPKPKPHKDGLLQACRELNVDPTKCVYIGDSPSDGLAAEAASMAAIGVSWGAHSKDSLQTQAPHFSYVCDSVEELTALLPQTTTSKR